MTSTPLIGAHCSGAGGLYRALLEGQSIGASCIQLFTANQKRWVSPSLTQEVIDQWHTTLAETGISHVMSHDSYLINLGSPREEVLFKSRRAFREEILRCQKLGIRYLNFHPGAALDDSREACAERIIASLLEVQDLMESASPLELLIETTAGQGSVYGYTLEEVATLVHGVRDVLPIGVCIDTCHLFAAGYDISTPAGWDAALECFDQLMGLRYLRALHLNDSQKGCGSRVDRHAPLGEGTIGMESFAYVMQHPPLRDLPKYLETPDGPPLWKKEIALLRQFAAGGAPSGR